MTRWRCPVPEAARDPRIWSPLVVLAATVLGEAEGEDEIGKRAVAYVVMNRAADSRWPDDPAEVCLQKLQFSCWNVGSPRIPTMFRPQGHVTEEVWNACFRVALEAMFKLEPDPSMGANHYLAPKSLAKLPSWAVPDKLVAQLGRHSFYRL